MAAPYLPEARAWAVAASSPAEARGRSAWSSIVEPAAPSISFSRKTAWWASTGISGPQRSEGGRAGGLEVRDEAFPHLCRDGRGGTGQGGALHSRRQRKALLAQAAGQGEGQRGHLGRFHGDAFIGRGTREGHGALEDPQAVHGLPGLGGPAPRGEARDGGGVITAEEVIAEGDDDFGPVQTPHDG